MKDSNKEWACVIKNQTDQQAVVKGYQTLGWSDFEGTIPIVVKYNQPKTFKFTTKNPNILQEGGGVEIHTNVGGTLQIAYFCIKGDNIGLVPDSYQSAKTNASDKQDKLLPYPGVQVTAQVYPGGALIKYQYT